MRHVLRTLKAQRGWTQEAAGKLLGVSQQTIAKLTSARDMAGFSRPTALALAKMCGFDSPESMLRDMGAAADPKAAPVELGNREIAAGIARRNGYDERAITRVTAMYTSSEYAARPVKWWLTRFGLEDQELAAADRVPPPPPSEASPRASGSPAIAPTVRKRRRTA